MITTFDIIAMTIRFTAILIHLVGIYCLLAEKRVKRKLRNILLHLSAVEILMTANLLILQYLRIYNINDDIIVHVLAWDGGNDITFYLIMCFIPLDRLLCTVLRMKYNYYVTTKRVNMILFGCWLFGFTFSIPFHFVKHEHVYTFFYHYCYQICDPICVLFAIISFTVIVRKLRQGRIRVSMQQPRLSSTASRRLSTKNKNSIVSQRNIYRIPFMIIVTFIVFYFIPDLIITIKNESELIAKVTPFIWSLGLMTDPLIYIFIHKKIRMRVWNLMKCGISFS